MTANNSVDGLTLTLVATGGINSLGWNTASQLILNSDLAREGILGEKDTITKLQIYNRNPKKSRALEKQLNTLLENNTALSKKKERKAFRITTIESIMDVAKHSDITLIGYDTVSGKERRAALKSTSKRAKSLNSNIPVLREWQNAFKNYEGLMVFLTNPSDYMAYFGIDILGLGKNQVVGFNHIDSFRLREELKYMTSEALEEIAGRKLSDKEKQTAINALKELNKYTAYILGNHSADSFGFFSNITWGSSKNPWNNHRVLSDEKIKQGIIKRIHKTARELSETIDGPNANCIPPIVDIIKGIVTSEGVFEMAYFLEISKELQDKIKEKYNAYITGVCTGVPVTFTKKGKRIRAEIAQEFRSDNHQIALANAEERAKFESVLESNAEQIAKATALKNKEGEYRFLEENTLLVVQHALSNELLLYETKKDIYNSDPSILFTKRKSALLFNCPDITAIATDGNKLATISGNSIQLWEMPYKNIAEIVSDETSSIKHVADLGNTDSGILQIALKGQSLYLAGSKRLEKKDLSGNSLAMASLDNYIWSINPSGSSVFCSCSGGQVIELDSNLAKKTVYETTDSKSKIVKTRVIMHDGETHLFGINAEGNVYYWKPGESKTGKKWSSQKPCFDIQAEKDQQDVFFSAYIISDDDLLEIKRINPATGDSIDKTKKEIYCSAVKDIHAMGNELYLISNNRIRSFLNLDTPNLDISLPNKLIKRACTVQYRK